MKTGISVLVVGAAGVGAVLIWSGLHGANASATLKDLLAGRAPLTPTDPQLSNELVFRAPPVEEGVGTASSPANKANGRLQAAAYGWSEGPQWTALDRLWTRESGWDNTAQNPHSTAFGIAQFLDATWAKYGPKTSDPTLQIRYGLAYIRDRYGSPVAAWAHETAQGWY